MTDREIIAELVAIRREHRLTQQNVADRLNISRPAVCRFETGAQNRSPLLHTILRYADAVGATLDVYEKLP